MNLLCKLGFHDKCWDYFPVKGRIEYCGRCGKIFIDWKKLPQPSEEERIRYHTENMNETTTLE